jgi:flagellar hook-basal body complex protein FliE
VTIAPIGSLGSLGSLAHVAGAPAVKPTPVAGASGAEGGDFGAAVANALDSLQATQNHADDLATKAATGDLQDVHDYTIAATEASLATELTVAVRNRAVDAFNEIMRMQV